MIGAKLRIIHENCKKKEKNLPKIWYISCISCGTCAGECPVEAISEGAERYVIDADACTECGTCASVCPSEAISLP